MVGCPGLVERESILAGGSSGAVVSALERFQDSIPDGASKILHPSIRPILEAESAQVPLLESETEWMEVQDYSAAPDELLVLSATSFRPETRESPCQDLEPTPADLFQTLRGFLQTFWNLEQTSRGLEQTLGGLVQTSQGPEQTPAALLETSRGLEPARGGRVQTSADLLQTSPGGDYEYEAGVG